MDTTQGKIKGSDGTVFEVLLGVVGQEEDNTLIVAPVHVVAGPDGSPANVATTEDLEQVRAAVAEVTTAVTDLINLSNTILGVLASGTPNAGSWNFVISAENDTVPVVDAAPENKGILFQVPEALTDGLWVQDPIQGYDQPYGFHYMPGAPVYFDLNAFTTRNIAFWTSIGGVHIPVSVIRYFG